MARISMARRVRACGAGGGLVLACVILGGAAAPSAGGAGSGDSTVGRVASDSTAFRLMTGNAEFGLELFRRAAGPGNALLSPFSLGTALAMTWAGARGETAGEMARVLRFPDASDSVNAVYGALCSGLAQRLPGDSTQALLVANRLWGQSALRMRPPFLDLTERVYGAALEPLDFAGEPEASRRRINSWVGEKTLGHIPELLASGSIRPATVLVLTNALYFKGTWARRFDPAATRPLPFHRTPGDSSPVPTMSQTAMVPYLERADLQVLSLPYEVPGLSMVILLPREPSGLPALEAGLRAADVESWVAQSESTRVEIDLPRFRFANEYQLRGALKELGMTRVFGGAADLSGMFQGGGVSVSDVVHKSVVEVDEKGSEASAATAVVVSWGRKKNPQPPPPLFRADHPFLFVIRDARTGAWLFLARVQDPSS